MTIEDLLTLLGTMLQSEDIVENQMIDEGTWEEIEWGEFGLLDDEQLEKDDEYIERKRTDTYPAVRRITRSSAIAETKRRSSSVSIPRKKKHGISSKKAITTTNDNTSCPSVTEEEDTVILLGSNQIFKHGAFTTVQKEEEYISSIFNDIINVWYVKLTKVFAEHVAKVVPQNLKGLGERMMDIYKRQLFGRNHHTILCGPMDDVREYASGDKNSQFFSRVTAALLFSSCSESSCERLFSHVKFISGKRRYNLTLSTLNNSISICERGGIQDST